MTTRSQGSGLDVARLAPGELVGADDDLGRLEGAELALLDGGVVGLGLQDAAGQEELLGQLLIPLLAQIGRRDDQDAPLALRPFLREDQARLDGLAETDLVGQQRALGERRLEGEQGGIDLMGIQIDLGARRRRQASRRCPAGSGGSARRRSTWPGSR